MPVKAELVRVRRAVGGLRRVVLQSTEIGDDEHARFRSRSGVKLTVFGQEVPVSLCWDPDSKEKGGISGGVYAWDKKGRSMNHSVGGVRIQRGGTSIYPGKTMEIPAGAEGRRLGRTLRVGFSDKDKGKVVYYDRIGKARSSDRFRLTGLPTGSGGKR